MCSEESRCQPPHSDQRRAVLKGAVGVASLSLIDVAAAVEPQAMRPQAGDSLVYAYGDRKGEIIKVADLELGGPQQLAWAMDPQTRTVRDGSRLNQVLLIRLSHEELSPETRTDSADGVVAYSSICTHQGCDVSQWRADNKMLLCVCHRSEFDPKDKAAVTFGPAPRRLPMLPVKMVEGQLQVAGGFRGKPGFKDM
jgi:rieske iron-sulfur protein